MLIRPAIRDDIPSLLHIEQQSESAAHWSPAAYHSIFAVDAPPRRILVAGKCDCANEIHGFVIARSLGDEWEIENLVVAPQQRRLGIGKELLQTLLNDLQSAGARAVLLEVRESNLAARWLYEKYGFRKEGRRPGYYQNPDEAALLFRRTLQLCDNMP